MTNVLGVVTDHNFNSFIISADKEFESHFLGFHSLKCVSYVVSMKWLLEFLEKYGFDSAEIVIGKEVSDLKPEDLLKEELRNANAEMAEKVFSLIQGGKLRIYNTDRIMHSKFYILHGDHSVRVMQGSANLTTSARKGFNS